MKKAISMKNLLIAASVAVFGLSAFVASITMKTIVQAEEYTPFVGFGLSLDDGLMLRYDVEVDDGIEVGIVGEGGELYNVETITEKTEGYYVYCGVTPSLMGETVKATVIGSDYVFETSVKDYCIDLINATKDELGLSCDKLDAAQQLAKDVLNYGAAAQAYTGVGSGSVNEGVDTSAATRYNEYESPVSVKASAGAASDVAYIRGAGARFDSQIGVYFTVVAPDTAGLSVELSIGGAQTTLTEFFATDTKDVYKVYYDNIYASEYDATMTAQVYQGETPVGNQVTYSVDSYIKSMENDSEMGDLVKSLYVFSNSAREYNAVSAEKTISFTNADLIEGNDGKVYFRLVATTNDGYRAEEFKFIENNGAELTAARVVREGETLNVDFEATQFSLGTHFAKLAINGEPYPIGNNGIDFQSIAEGNKNPVPTKSVTVGDYQFDVGQHWETAKFTATYVGGVKTVSAVTAATLLQENSKVYYKVTITTADTFEAHNFSLFSGVNEKFAEKIEQVDETTLDVYFDVTAMEIETVNGYQPFFKVNGGNWDTVNNTSEIKMTVVSCSVTYGKKVYSIAATWQQPYLFVAEKPKEFGNVTDVTLVEVDGAVYYRMIAESSDTFALTDFNLYDGLTSITPVRAVTEGNVVTIDFDVTNFESGTVFDPHLTVCGVKPAGWENNDVKPTNGVNTNISVTFDHRNYAIAESWGMPRLMITSADELKITAINSVNLIEDGKVYYRLEVTKTGVGEASDLKWDNQGCVVTATRIVDNGSTMYIDFDVTQFNKAGVVNGEYFPKLFVKEKAWNGGDAQVKINGFSNETASAITPIVSGDKKYSI